MPGSPIAIAAACCLLLGGCGASAGPDQTATADPLSETQIKKALLTIDDLPSGFSKDPDLALDEEGSADDVTQGTKQCRDLLSALNDENRGKPFGEGQVGFKEGDAGPFIEEQVTSFEGSTIKKSMATLREAFASCKEFQTKDSEGVVTEFTVAPMTFPDLGDDSIAVQLGAIESSVDFEIAMSLVVVRVDQNVVLLGNYGLGSGLGGGKFESIARTAVDKVSQASQS